MSDTTTPSTRPSVTHGMVEDPAELQTGDFGLDGDLRATMLDALEKNWNADDPGATDIPADTDPAATPPTPAPTSPEGEGAGAGGDAAAGDGAAPDPAAAPPAPTPPADGQDDFTLDAYAREYFGTQLTKEQARDLFGVLGGLQALTPEQRQQLDQVLAGGNPGQQYPVTTGTPVTQPTAPPSVPGSSPTSSPIIPPRPDDEYEAQLYDRYIAPLAATIDGRVKSIEEQVALTTQQQLLQQQRANDSIIANASTSWRAQYPDLTDGEYDALTDRIIRSGVFPAVVNAHGGDFSAATQAVLEQHFWADPNLRSKAIANLASGRAPGDATTQTPEAAASSASDAAHRQARAASVSGGGGAVTPRGDQASTPNTADGRKKAMISEIAAEGDFS